MILIGIQYGHFKRAKLLQIMLRMHVFISYSVIFHIIKNIFSQRYPMEDM